MSERLDRELEQHFKGIPNGELARRIEEAEPFEGDDEAYELTRRLGQVGLKWCIVQNDGRERVAFYVDDSDDEDRGYD